MPNLIYVEYAFQVRPLQPATEILIAQLGEIGFESFVEQPTGVMAYIQKKDWQPELLHEVTILENESFQIQYTVQEIEQQNWNATWEQGFEPIQVADRCTVRAPFHEPAETEFDIVIMPKMSFGTGHHETTHMMLQLILDQDFEGKSVLDMGSGTAVLAILTALKGAIAIEAIDIDHWCYLNAKENVERNNCAHIRVYKGDVALLTGKKYDLVLANINRNILLKDIPTYADTLGPKGLLFLSGFYLDDLPQITARCKEVGFQFVENLQKNDWVAAKYIKI